MVPIATPRAWEKKTSKVIFVQISKFEMGTNFLDLDYVPTVLEITLVLTPGANTLKH